MLADGYTIKETAEEIGVADRTISRWKDDIEFSSEVDRLSLMVGIASRGERLRMAKRIIKRLVEKQIPTHKDLLEWLKYAQSETDGIKLDLTALLDDVSSLAAGRSDGLDSAPETGDEQDENE